MTDVTMQREAPLPKTMPMLLSFVAGYVDSYTYLALIGLARETSGKALPLMLTRPQSVRGRGDPRIQRVRGQLLTVLSVAVGFLVGAAAGAVGHHQCARRIARRRNRRGACALGALSRETCLSVITRESG